MVYCTYWNSTACLISAAYIKRKDGFFGCYRGVTPKLIGNLLAAYSGDKIANALGLKPLPDEEGEITNEIYQYQLKRDVVMHISGVIISHPLHVVSVRMMAEFIGQDNKYK